MPTNTFIPYQTKRYEPEEMIDRANAFYKLMDRRRSVREFSDRPVPREVIDQLIRTASTAPSGAHKQPWTFCVLTNAEIRRAVREKAEEEERKSYEGRMSEQWLRDLQPLGTDHNKPFIEDAPYVVVVFKRAYEFDSGGNKLQNYYVNESVGIAVGMFLAAAHHAGLATLTHTPSPMNFLAEILHRPENERAFVLIPVGFPAKNTRVPDLKRKALEEVCVYYD